MPTLSIPLAAGDGEMNGDGHEDLLFGCKDYSSGLGAVYTVLGR